MRSIVLLALLAASCNAPTAPPRTAATNALLAARTDPDYNPNTPHPPALRVPLPGTNQSDPLTCWSEGPNTHCSRQQQ